MFDVISIATGSEHGDIEVESIGTTTYLSQPNDRDRDIMIIYGSDGVRDLITALTQALEYVEGFERGK